MTQEIDDKLQYLLNTLDPDASLAQRHLWLYGAMAWIRGDDEDIQKAVGRVRQLLSTVQPMTEWRLRWREWWLRFVTDIDVTPLLADAGFAPRNAFVSEMAHRLRKKIIPATPETTDLGELFVLLFPTLFDAQWIKALDEKTLQQLGTVLLQPMAQEEQDPVTSDLSQALEARETALTQMAGMDTPGAAELSYWQEILIDAISYSLSQINAIGFASEIRTRMSNTEDTARVFHELPVAMFSFVRVLRLHGAQSDAARLSAQILRGKLQASKVAISTVYDHLDQHGISVGIVFMLKQVRDRVQRVNQLLDCLMSEQQMLSAARMISRLVRISRDRRSLRKLWQENTHLTAAKVAERHALSGESYITRNFHDWRALLGKAFGGGLVMGVAVWFKFVLAALALSIFWTGLSAGINYALAFVVIQLMQWTVATKQPAVTAPAMAAKLKNIDAPDAIPAFVDEVAHLFRSQVAAIVGNLLAVVPMAILISMALLHYTGSPMISDGVAFRTMASLDIIGPTVLFAAITGVLLYLSSLIGGWLENSFVLNRLDSIIAHHPRSRQLFGTERAARWSQWWRENISGLGANISLGLMLGLVPSFAQFFGIGFEVRHVTLAAGQLGAAAHTLGLEVLQMQQFWLALLGVALIGPINVMVNFYMAFRTALAAQNVQRVDRHRIYDALRNRMLYTPFTFFFPPAGTSGNGDGKPSD